MCHHWSEKIKRINVDIYTHLEGVMIEEELNKYRATSEGLHLVFYHEGRFYQDGNRHWEEAQIHEEMSLFLLWFITTVHAENMSPFTLLNRTHDKAGYVQGGATLGLTGPYAKGCPLFMATFCHYSLSLFCTVWNSLLNSLQVCFLRNQTLIFGCIVGQISCVFCVLNSYCFLGV